MRTRCLFTAAFNGEKFRVVITGIQQYKQQLVVDRPIKGIAAMSIRNHLLFATAVALASMATEASAAPPATDPVIASFGITMINEPTTYTCTGDDGTYTEFLDTFSGPLLSTDPRLNGTLTVSADILVNNSTGLGAGSGTWNVKNLLGQQLVSGTFTGAVSGFVLFKGIATGRSTQGDKFFGSLSVAVTGNVAVGSIGAALDAVPVEPGVFQVGSCTGSGPNP